jgi:hypothetical protein
MGHEVLDKEARFVGLGAVLAGRLAEHCLADRCWYLAHGSNGSKNWVTPTSLRTISAQMSGMSMEMALVALATALPSDVISRGFAA